MSKKFTSEVITFVNVIKDTYNNNNYQSNQQTEKSTEQKIKEGTNQIAHKEKQKSKTAAIL